MQNFTHTHPDGTRAQYRVKGETLAKLRSIKPPRKSAIKTDTRSYPKFYTSTADYVRQYWAENFPDGQSNSRDFFQPLNERRYTDYMGLDILTVETIEGDAC
jgi:hypothetical protein